MNTLSNKPISAMMQALDHIELDPSVGVIITTGARQASSAGADITRTPATFRW